MLEKITQEVKNLFPTATGMMLTGSRAVKKNVTPNSDYDYLIVHEGCIVSAFRDLDIAGFSVDITIIPTINFDSFLLSEAEKQIVSPVLHSLEYGEIIFDNNGQLTFFKVVGSYLFSNHRQMVYLCDSTFKRLIKTTQKLISDFLPERPISENYFILAQIINNLTDLLLISKTGWTTSGKVKARMLMSEAPQFSAQMNSVIEQKGEDYFNHLSNSQTTLTKLFHELSSDNKSELNYKSVTIGLGKLVISSSNKQAISNIFYKISTLEEAFSCFPQTFPVEFNSEHRFRLIIKGEHNELSKKIIPILQPVLNRSIFFSTIKFAEATETFGIGRCITQIIEDFLCSLSRIIFYRNMMPAGGEEHISLGFILLSIINQNAKIKDEEAFLRYLFDCWIPYRWSKKTDIKAFTLAEIVDFTSYDARQQTKFEKIFKAVHEGADSLLGNNYKQIQVSCDIFFRSLEGVVLTVPDHELTRLSNYNLSTSKSACYIFRKTLEGIMMLASVEARDWIYLLQVWSILNKSQ